jgi:hypothetical protein
MGDLQINLTAEDRARPASHEIALDIRERMQGSRCRRAPA